MKNVKRKTGKGNKPRTVTCGKCQQSFLAGGKGAHNARTCRKEGKPYNKPLVPPPTINSVIEKPNREGVPVKKVFDILQQTNQTTIKSGKIPSSQYDSCDWDENGLVRINQAGFWVKISPELASQYQYIKGNYGEKIWFNQDSLLHRIDGPAIIYTDGTKQWYSHGKLHRIDGPAITYADGDGEWWVNGVVTNFSHLCERAVLPDLTDEEFYELCTHEDYVVRQLAAHNPHCPAEWRTLVDIMDG